MFRCKDHTSLINVQHEMPHATDSSIYNPANKPCDNSKVSVEIRKQSAYADGPSLRVRTPVNS